MTIPARRDPAAEALQLAAYRRQEGMYRGFMIKFIQPIEQWLWTDMEEAYGPNGMAPTAAAARRAVDELLSKETRV